MTGSMDISVVIVSWNSQAIVAQCLEALTRHRSKYSFEIILVDNASSDGTPDMAASRFPQVRLIRNSENLGFAKANNIGIRQAKGRYVCLMNSDIVIRDACFDRMIEYLEQHADIGILGPKLLNPDLTLQDSCQSFPTLWNNLCEALSLNRLFPRSRFFSERHWIFFAHDRICDVPVLPAAFWLVRREAFEQEGLFDEQFFIYCEDMDLCKRFWNRGWKVIFSPEAEAVHHHGGSSSNLPARFHLEQQRTALQYWRKHHGRLGVFGISVVKVLHHLIRLIPRLAALLRPGKDKKAAIADIQRSFYSILFYLRIYRL